MPAQAHPTFSPPADLNVSLWRYMDFTKFVWMLEQKALYFARADTLGDPFEGSYTSLNKFAPDEVTPDEAEKISKHFRALNRSMPQRIFVNCWHMNSGESAGMWRLYAKTNEAIAIRTTYAKLANAMSDGYLGVVQYIDFATQWIPIGNTFNPFVHKRKSFSHEAELRAVLLEWPRDEKGEPLGMDAKSGKKGITQSVDLNSFIEEVYVAPTSADWFRDLVEDVCERYLLNAPVHQSSLDAEPFF